MWLRGFEHEEVDELDRNTVTPQDYSVYVPWIPADATERELVEFFSRGGHKVVDVFLAYDNGDLIEKYKERGAKQFEHYKIGQEIRYEISIQSRHSHVSLLSCLYW